MKNLLIIVALLVLLASCKTNTEVVSEECVDTVNFASINLEKEVAKALEISGSVSCEKILELTKLRILRTEIGSLDGLEHAENLKNITLNGVGITDISPLAKLFKLESLTLYGNNISDLKPLKNLSELSYLSLQDNPLTDISALADLNRLTLLNIGANKSGKSNVSDISVLKNLSNLRTLYIYNNPLDENDLKVLTKLPNLNRLDLSQLGISDISIVKNLPQLTRLELSKNKISDITAIKDLTKLEILRLNSNGIKNINSLKGLVNLKELDLASNLITDISVFDANLGLHDSGDKIKILFNCLDLSQGSQALNTINKLIASGATVSYQSPNNSACP